MISLNAVIASKKLCTMTDLGLDHCANFSWSVNMWLKYCFAKGFVFYLYFPLIRVPAVL